MCNGAVLYGAFRKSDAAFVRPQRGRLQLGQMSGRHCKPRTVGAAFRSRGGYRDEDETSPCLPTAAAPVCLEPFLPAYPPDHSFTSLAQKPSGQTHLQSPHFSTISIPTRRERHHVGRPHADRRIERRAKQENFDVVSLQHPLATTRFAYIFIYPK